MSWLPSTGKEEASIVALFSGCASMIGFLLGFAAAVVLAAWGHW